MPALIRTEGLVNDVSLQRVATGAERLLAAYGMNEVELSILLVDDERMAELNYTYRQKKKPTNVLSFPIPEETGFGAFFNKPVDEFLVTAAKEDLGLVLEFGVENACVTKEWIPTDLEDL